MPWGCQGRWRADEGAWAQLQAARDGAQCCAHLLQGQTCPLFLFIAYGLRCQGKIPFYICIHFSFSIKLFLLHKI